VPNDQHACVRACQCAIDRQKAYKLATILNDWPKYAEADLNAMIHRNVRQENLLVKMRMDPGASYYISGLYSQGKTHFLVAQYRFQALAGRKCLLRTAHNLAEELRRADITANEKDPDISEVMQLANLSKDGHLFVDDFEKIRNTDFRMEMLWNLLDTITRRQLRLTVTSNLPMISQDGKPDLKGKLGSAIISRLDQICRRVEL
jgi:DNA replication protein DnaC